MCITCRPRPVPDALTLTALREEITLNSPNTPRRGFDVRRHLDNTSSEP